MSARMKKWGLLLSLWLTACAASGTEVRESGGETEALGVLAAWEAAEEEEGCEEDDACVTLLCDEEACGVYRCGDVEWEPVLLASRGGIAHRAGAAEDP